MTSSAANKHKKQPTDIKTASLGETSLLFFAAHKHTGSTTGSTTGNDPASFEDKIIS